MMIPSRQPRRQYFHISDSLKSTQSNTLVKTLQKTIDDDKTIQKTIQKTQDKLLLQKTYDTFNGKVACAQRKSFAAPFYKTNPFLQFYNTQTFDNQKQFGQLIADSFIDNQKLLQLFAIAPTQSGKTGSMLATMFHFMDKPFLNLPKQNIFIFTAHSSREWLLQTKSRFPSFLHDNILHRNQLKTIVQKLTNLNNVLLIIDEVQIAAKFKQTLFKLFHHLNLFDIQSMLDRNFKIVHFTATPDNLLQHATIWQQFSHTLFMQVPAQYTSHIKLYQANRILPAKDLNGYDFKTHTVDPAAIDNIKHLKHFILTKYTSPRYHIIRTGRGILHHVTIRNFKQVFYNDNHSDDADRQNHPENSGMFQFISEPAFHDRNKQFDELLHTQPTTHTFVFIIDKLRCAKTIHHQFIGVLYERTSKTYPKFSSVVQSLAGRLSGYHSNHDAVCFTHIPSILAYFSFLRNSHSSPTLPTTLSTLHTQSFIKPF